MSSIAKTLGRFSILPFQIMTKALSWSRNLQGNEHQSVLVISEQYLRSFGENHAEKQRKKERKKERKGEEGMEKMNF